MLEQDIVAEAVRENQLGPLIRDLVQRGQILPPHSWGWAQHKDNRLACEGNCGCEGCRDCRRQLGWEGWDALTCGECGHAVTEGEQ